MPLQKNQVLTLTIERLSNDGSGVAHSPDARPCSCPAPPPATKPTSASSRTAAAMPSAFWTPAHPSPDRIPVDCAVAGPCGGCSLRHLDYAAELRAKQENVVDAFRRIGGLDVPVLDSLPSPEVDRYRNKSSSRSGVTRTAPPASASTPVAPTASSPAPTASCSPAS